MKTTAITCIIAIPYIFFLELKYTHKYPHVHKCIPTETTKYNKA